MLLQRMGRPAKGLPDADRAIALNPRSAMALYVRAKIYEALGRTEEAAAGMRAALADRAQDYGADGRDGADGRAVRVSGSVGIAAAA